VTVVQGRRVAVASVVAVLVLGGGAAGYSFATSPLVPDYGSLPANDAAAASSLRATVEATLDSESYSVEVTQTISESRAGGSGVLDYLVRFQAPDRSEMILDGMTTVSIGSTRYFTSGRTVEYESTTTYDPSTKHSTTTTRTVHVPEHWYSEPAKPPLAQGAIEATQWLELLLRADSVQRSGNTFRTEQLYTGNELVAPRRYAAVTTTVLAEATVAGGRVVSEIVKTLAPKALTGNVTNTLSYVEFDTSPAIDAPPRVDVVPGACSGAPGVPLPRKECSNPLG
jgi:hypothetical protein